MIPGRRRSAPAQLETPRLILRQWKRSDAAPYADRLVMAFHTSPLNRRESNAALQYFRTLIAQQGWGVWAVERKRDRVFLGAAGLHTSSAALPFSPGFGVGWRLARAHREQGYAAEAAMAALQYGFETLALPEIVAFSPLLNVKSQAVMRRLGMRTDPAWHFEHPDVPMGSPLRKHCLYRMGREEWERRDVPVSAPGAKGEKEG